MALTVMALTLMVEEEFDYWNTVNLYKHRANRRKCRGSCRFYSRVHMSRHNKHCCFHNYCYQRQGKQCFIEGKRHLKHAYHQKRRPKYPVDIKKLPNDTVTWYKTQSFQRCSSRHVILISEELFKSMLQEKEEKALLLVRSCSTKIKGVCSELDNSDLTGVSRKKKRKRKKHKLTTDSSQHGETKMEIAKKKKSMKKKQLLSLEQMQKVKGHGVPVINAKVQKKHPASEISCLRNGVSSSKSIGVVPKQGNEITSTLQIPILPQISIDLLQPASTSGHSNIVTSNSVDIAAKKKIPQFKRFKPLVTDDHFVHSSGVSACEQTLPVASFHASFRTAPSSAEKETSRDKAQKISQKKVYGEKKALESFEQVVITDNGSTSQLSETPSLSSQRSKETNKPKHRISAPKDGEFGKGNNWKKVFSDCEPAETSSKERKTPLLEKPSLNSKPCTGSVKVAATNSHSFNPEPSKNKVRELILEVLKANGICPQRHVPCERKFDAKTVNPYSLRYFSTKEFAWLCCPNCKSTINALMYCYIDLKTQKICHRFEKECKQCKHHMVPRFSPEAIEQMATNAVRQYSVFVKNKSSRV